MKKYRFGLLAIIVAILAFQSNGSALTTTQYTTKPIMVTITITPSPVPVVFAPSVPRRASSSTEGVALASAPAFDSLEGGVPAMEGAGSAVQPESSLELALDQGVQVAQVQTVPGGNVPVNVLVKPDPTSAYLHITPVTPNLSAAYGLNTFTCVYQVFASFSKTWKVDDWVYGTAPQGGSGTFPGWTYPTASQASWFAQGISTGYTAFTNSGTPGQLAFTGVANVAKTVCFDLQINVTNDIPAGTYSLPVTYALYVTF
jgi:hypothetical protein